MNMSTSDFGGGGGGALNVLREHRWTGPADNACVFSVTGQVVDTGIGIMPALDVMRQKHGMPTTADEANREEDATSASAGGALGSFGGQSLGAATGAAGVGAGVGTGVGAGRQSQKRPSPTRSPSNAPSFKPPLSQILDDHWDDEDELGTSPYMLEREILEGSLGG